MVHAARVCVSGWRRARGSAVERLGENMPTISEALAIRIRSHPNRLRSTVDRERATSAGGRGVNSTYDALVWCGNLGGMPSVRENMQGIRVTRDALREIGAALTDLAVPLPDPIPGTDWDQKLAEVGPRYVDVVQMQYQIESRIFDDGPTSHLSDTSFDSWPPAAATQVTTKFHVFIPEHDAQYPWLQIPYVQIESGAQGWVNVMAWAYMGETASRIMDTVIEVLRRYPAPVEMTDPPVVNNSVFVGHGGDRQWEVVRDYLLEAGFNVEAFESDERAGLATLEVVSQMIHSSRVAVVVMTAVDQLADGRMFARQNVVHEIGFAQGALGVPNTIILLEEGAEEFTNIAGLTQIRFRRGEIHTTKSRVLAVAASRGISMGGC